MGLCSQKELKKIILLSYKGNESIDELIAFYHLTQKFKLYTISEIYPKEVFFKYIDILKSLKLIEYNEEEISIINSDRLEKLFSINTEWLRYYVILAETKNVRLTSKKLNLTPAAISKAIKGIEDILQVILLERDKKFGKMTFIGEIVYEKSKKILNSLSKVNNTFNIIKSGEAQGELNIAWFLTWGKDIITKTVVSFMKKYPRVYIKIKFVSGVQIEKSLSDGTFDIGIMPQKPTDENFYVSDSIDVKYAIVGKPQPKKNWNEFSYIVKSDQLERFSHSSVLSPWPEKEFKRNIIMECNSITGITELCKTGLGVAFLPVSALSREFDKGTLDIVADSPFEYNNKIYIVYHKEIFLTSALLAFLKEFKENIESGI